MPEPAGIEAGQAFLFNIRSRILHILAEGQRLIERSGSFPFPQPNAAALIREHLEAARN